MAPLKLRSLSPWQASLAVHIAAAEQTGALPRRRRRAALPLAVVLLGSLAAAALFAVLAALIERALA